MLTWMLRILLLLVLVSQSFGCKSYQLERGHHISVDEEGRALGRVTKTDSSDKGDFTLPLFASSKQKYLTDEEFKAEYIAPILNNMERYVIEQHENGQTAQILLFIHGGLNSYEGGLEHIQGFLEKQKDVKTFPNLSSHFLLSLNWEAGLQSALIDHFFFIRFGERSPIFASLTFPIVLLHDLGNSIIKAPDAIYSEAKDLLKNQSVDYMSASLTTALLASGYGLPIAALHPTLTVAGMMPYATYAAAGVSGIEYFDYDKTRYVFAPIRMASAPFIEGFGTPAWDMLKRRSDLLLFNPATRKDGATRQLLTRLASKIRNGMWKTDSCASLKPNDCPSVELTLVGHSMGAIVSDRILTTLSKDLTFKHIIYLGAANSIADFKASVIPYLRDHNQTEFWSFALSEENETNETYAFDFLSRGSLLVWIDLLFERTYGLPQKRFGTEVNQEWVHIDDDQAWKRICRISFSGNRLRTEEPKKHGEFTEAEKVELVLGMVKDGCPKPVKLTKDHSDTRTDEEFRQDLKKALRHIPRLTPKSIAGIADNAPYANIDDLTNEEFLSTQSYGEIRKYFYKTNINVATIDELSRILRGDRYLAKQIFDRACEKPFGKDERVKVDIPHLSDEADRLIGEYGFVVDEPRPISTVLWFGNLRTSLRTLNIKGLFLGDPGTDMPTCTPSDWWWPVKRWSSAISLSGRPTSLDELRNSRNASDLYRRRVLSEIERVGMNILPIEKTRTWHIFPPKTPWDAVLEIQGQRVGIKIHTWAGLEYEYRLDDRKPDLAEEFADDIKRHAEKSEVDAIIFVTFEDAFSKQSMAKAKEAIQKALGEKFHSVYGLPKTIPDKIKSVLQPHTKERIS